MILDYTLFTLGRVSMRETPRNSLSLYIHVCAVAPWEHESKPDDRRKVNYIGKTHHLSRRLIDAWRHLGSATFAFLKTLASKMLDFQKLYSASYSISERK
jgi:hypothetical protein